MATSYGDCVAALRGSLSHLESSVETLGNGVSDFPRLISVLKAVRHYELIPQPTLAAAETSLRDEIGPAITVLLDRADSHIDRVERRIESFKARAELQQGRLTETTDSRDASSGRSKSSTAQKLGGEAKLRAKAVKQRKEALEYSIERLELEVLQKERELRKQVEKA
ncbi:putative DASH complex subunit SPC19 [Seiridium unicorne]|uniref:DASH complex subunit SPC19 n=1 Tax=Seiridium unicorne TaxID=138068 RepID=A0ABR2UWI4_9PEZI